MIVTIPAALTVLACLVIVGVIGYLIDRTA
jgi:preprotein translocase subunit Sss1